MKMIHVILLVLLVCVFVVGYTAPAGNQIGIVLDTGYTAPSGNQVEIRLADVEVGVSSLTIELLEPIILDNFNATQLEYFDVKVNVTCSGANCGNVNVSLDPIITDCNQIASSGEWDLDADIIDSTNATCMDIIATDVILDCNGNMIDGDHSANFGIYIDDGTTKDGNITIKNCIVSEWRSEGMWVDQISNVTVLNSRFVNNTNNSANGIQFARTSDIVVNNSLFEFNGDSIRIINMYQSVIDNSNFTNELGYGLLIDTGLLFEDITSNLTVTNCLFKGNAVASLSIEEGNEIWFSNNIFNDSKYLDRIDGINVFFNLSNETGSRITSTAPDIGGNYYTNSTSTGYSDVCTDSDSDGYCDTALNVTSQEAFGAGEGPTYVDFLPYSDQFGASEPKSGLISTVEGDTPFWTNDSNPRTISLTKGQSITVIFSVNATGVVDVTHNFFAFANITTDLSIGARTVDFNVTIREAVVPPVGDSCTPPASGTWNITDWCNITTIVQVPGDINLSNYLNITDTGFLNFTGSGQEFKIMPNAEVWFMNGSDGLGVQ